jgi:acetolactate synthase-1/2/3 large subunit
MIRGSDLVMDYIAAEGVEHVFLVSGGGGMYLLDSLGRRKDIAYVCTHHEQAAAISAEAYPRVRGGIGVALVTTGPAGTNALTGVGCAWTDSIPLLVVSGQARTTHLVGDRGLRQRGFHEANISKIAAPITKYAVCVLDPKTLAYHMEKAIFLAKSGRPGPVWVDVPLDVQGAMLDPKDLVHFDARKEYPELFDEKPVDGVAQVVQWLKAAKRPLFLAGHGVRLSGSAERFTRLVEAIRVPVVTSRSAFDVLHHDHPLRAGFIGTYGQRAANFAVQNSDLLIILGSRLAFILVGYETHLFAREAKKVAVDVDANQLKHALIPIDLPIVADVKRFLPELEAALAKETLPDYGPWVEKVQRWRGMFPNVTPAMHAEQGFVNAYVFYEVLSEELEPEDMMIWDQGAAFYCSSVAFKVKPGQRSFSNVGFTPMGYGLPAAVGACIANGKQRLACVHGEGGLMLNVQELQTIMHHRLPIKLFVFSNQGYTSIKHTQQQYFDGFFVGSDPSSGLTCPDMVKLAEGFGMPAMRVGTNDEVRAAIRKALDLDGPVLVDVTLDPLAPVEPRTKSERLPDGRMVSKPLEDMWPYLDRDLFRREMIAKPVGE